MTAATKRHPAGAANYPGECLHVVGEVKGPTTFGSLLVATAATYDAATHSTRVEFATCTDDDLDQIVKTGVARVDVGAGS